MQVALRLDNHDDATEGVDRTAGETRAPAADLDRPHEVLPTLHQGLPGPDAGADLLELFRGSDERTHHRREIRLRRKVPELLGVVVLDAGEHGLGLAVVLPGKRRREDDHVGGSAPVEVEAPLGGRTRLDLSSGCRLDPRGVVAGVAQAIAVGVGLVADAFGLDLSGSVCLARAVVELVHEGVLVGVELSRVENAGRVVLAVRDPIAVAVLCILLGSRLGVLRAEVALVAHAVVVAVLLVGVGVLGAVVARVPHAVAVSLVLLIVVAVTRGVVAGVARFVAVGVRLLARRALGLRQRTVLVRIAGLDRRLAVLDVAAVVAGVADAVAVVVGLVLVDVVAAVVAGVADAVAVVVGLVLVDVVAAVVAGVVVAVVVGVSSGVLDAGAPVDEDAVVVVVEDPGHVGELLLARLVEGGSEERLLLGRLRDGARRGLVGEPLAIAAELAAPGEGPNAGGRRELGLVHGAELSTQPLGLRGTDLLTGRLRAGLAGAFRGRGAILATTRGTTVLVLLHPAARGKEQGQQEPQRGVLLRHRTPPFIGRTSWVAHRRPTIGIPRATRRWAVSPRQAG